MASLLQKLHGHGKHRRTRLHIKSKVLIVLLLDMPSLTRKDIWEHFGSSHGKDCNATLDRCCWMSWYFLLRSLTQFQDSKLHSPWMILCICSWTRFCESTKSQWAKMVIEGLLLSNGFGFQTGAPCTSWVPLAADSGLRNGPRFSDPQNTFAASLHL